MIYDLWFNLDSLKELSLWNLWFDLYCLNYLILFRLFLSLILIILLCLMNFGNLYRIHDILVFIFILYFCIFLYNIFNIFILFNFYLTVINNIRCHISLFRWLLSRRHSIINILKFTSILILLSSHFPFLFLRVSISLIFQRFFLLFPFLLIFLFKLATKGMRFLYITLFYIAFIIFIKILLVIRR